MGIEPQMIRAESFSEVGSIIQRDAGVLVERWSRRAIEEQPNARRLHHEALLDHLPGFLRALGRSLAGTGEAETVGHCQPAGKHGEQRWETGWSLPEVVRDYQILRLVLLEYLEQTLDRPLDYREVMAIGLALDEAIAASVQKYARHREEHLRRFEDERARQARETQEALRQQAEALREADRRKNEFLATLAHELRNPLAPLRNGVNVLRLHQITDPTVVQVRDLFERQVQQMTRLVDDLLDVSRIAQGKIELRKERVNLATVVGQALQMCDALMKNRRHTLSVSLPNEHLWLEADQARLVQVIVNLLNNAAKYTPEGGRVWLRAERQGETAVLSVRDTGVGIAGPMLPHVFDLFTQAEWPADHSEGGLGIGLTLVRRLVELHGGTISAHSAGLGQGSKFVVQLPLCATGGEDLPAAEAGEAAAIARHILIVEDNADGRESLQTVLRLLGHRVDVAEDGFKGVEKALELRPEVALIDLGLPGLDGFQVAERMRASLGKAILLVALTGFAQPEDRRRVREVGFDAHLVKPVNLDELQKLLALPRIL
jgi:signal transduction histidine kinase